MRIRPMMQKKKKEKEKCELENHVYDGRCKNAECMMLMRNECVRIMDGGMCIMVDHVHDAGMNERMDPEEGPI